MQTLTHQAFSQHLNSKFQVQDNSGNQVVLELTEVSELLQSARQERFSIVFRGPNETFLGQGMRRFEHDQMEAFDLFIVPINRDEQGTYYEAVFNRLSKNT
jgi:hypothetical protein